MLVEKASGLAVNVSQDRQSMIFESYYYQTCNASLDKTLCYKLSVIYQSVCKDWNTPAILKDTGLIHFSHQRQDKPHSHLRGNFQIQENPYEMQKTKTLLLILE